MNHAFIDMCYKQYLTWLNTFQVVPTITAYVNDVGTVLPKEVDFKYIRLDNLTSLQMIFKTEYHYLKCLVIDKGGNDCEVKIEYDYIEG